MMTAKRIFFGAAFSCALVLAMPLSPAYAQQAPSGEVVVSRALPDVIGKILASFGKKDDAPGPEQTLQAPFSEDAPMAPTEGDVVYRSSDGGLYRAYTAEDGSVIEVPEYAAGSGIAQQIDIPHRRADDIATWLARAVSEMLTMNSANYQEHLRHLSTGMSEAGLVEFNNFVGQANIYSQLQDNDMELAGYVDELPILLNEGAVNGRYRWLFEMPVTVTFMPRDTRSYRRINNPEQNTLRFIIQTQIGRIEQGLTDDNVIIETWRARPSPHGQSSLPLVKPLE